MARPSAAFASPLAAALASLAAFTALAGAARPAAAEDDAPPLSIYGFARLDLLINDSRMSDLDAPTYVLSEPEAGQLASELTMTPRLSRLGLSIDPWELRGGLSAQGKLEVDFAGGGGAANALRLRHAYASLSTRRGGLELLAGQTWDLTSPLFPSAQNDLLLRHAGNLGERRPQLRLTGTLDRRVRVALAAAAPAVLDLADVDGDDQVDAIAAARPMLQWLLELRTPRGDAGARGGVSGHVAQTELGDGARRTAYSVSAHFYAPLGDRLIVLGEGYTGTNLAELGGGIGQGTSPRTREPIRSLGGWLELALLPTDRHMLSVGTSVDIAAEEDLAPGDRTRNGTIYSVLRYRPRPVLQLGLEHLYWKTSYVAMPGGVANRVNLHVSVFF